MNGYLKIGGILPQNQNYKKITDLTLLPALKRDSLVAGYSLKEGGAFNFATNSVSELVGKPPVKGEHGAFLNSESFIDTGVRKADDYTYLIVAPRTATVSGFLMGDYISKALSASGFEKGTTMSSRGDVFAGVPAGIASAFGSQATNVAGEITLFIFSCIKNSETSYTFNYVNVQGGRDIVLNKSIPDAVNDSDVNVGIGWSKKAGTLPWDVNKREIIYACLYDKGFTKAELENWIPTIRQELLSLKNIVI